MNTTLLNQPLDSTAIRHRKQGSVNLSYIEGYYAINKANEIFGFGEWSKNIESLNCVHTEEKEIKGRKRYDVHYIARVAVSVSQNSEVLF